MDKTRSKDMIFDFLNTVFLLVLIAFCVFYFIVGDNWAVAEKIVKISFSLSIFGILFLIKLKMVRREIKREKNSKSFDDIAVYFSHGDKIKDLIIIFTILLLMFLGSFFWSPNLKISFWQILIIFLFLYFWHIYLFRKRDSSAVRMYATILDELVDSVFIYFTPIIVLSISLLYDSYSEMDIANALILISILYLRHKILFVLNDKK